MANNHMKRCSESEVIREMQVKTTLRQHYLPIRIAEIENLDTKCWWQCGVTGTLILLLAWMQNGTDTLRECLAISYKVKYTLTARFSNCIPWYLPKWVKNWCPHKNPGGPVVRTQPFHCGGLGSIHGQGTKIPWAVWHGQRQKQKLKKNFKK